MAPEIEAGEVATPASDVYSLGLTLCAAVTGMKTPGRQDAKRVGRIGRVLSALLQEDPAKRPTAARARHMLFDVAEASKRTIVLRVAAVAAGVVAVSIALWWTLSSKGASQTQLEPQPKSSPPAVTPAPVQPLGLMGDPRTADPCALTDATALSRFGEAELDTNYGNFNRCDAIVHVNKKNPDDDVVVSVELEAPWPDAPPPSKEVTIDRHPLADGDCERTLHLPDGYQVAINAKYGHQADLCAMADAITSGAQLVLQRGQIPRRATPLEPASVARLNACSLLATSDVASVLPGAGDSQKGLGDWSCEWNPKAVEGKVLVNFDHNSRPLDSSDGRLSKLSGFATYVAADDPHTCLAKIVYRPFNDPDPGGQVGVELVQIMVQGTKPSSQLCGSATKLAGVVASKLHN
jgi:hypothetical protein